MSTTREKEFDDKRRHYEEVVGGSAPADEEPAPDPMKVRCQYGIVNVWSGFTEYLMKKPGECLAEYEYIRKRFPGGEAFCQRRIEGEIDCKVRSCVQAVMNIIQSLRFIFWIAVPVSFFFAEKVSRWSVPEETFDKYAMFAIIWLFCYGVVAVIISLSVLCINIVGDLTVVPHRWVFSVKLMSEGLISAHVNTWLMFRNLVFQLTHGSAFFVSYGLLTWLMMHEICGYLDQLRTDPLGQNMLNLAQWPGPLLFVWPVVPVAMSVVGIFVWVVEGTTKLVLVPALSNNRLRVQLMGSSDAWFEYSQKLASAHSSSTWRGALNFVFEMYLRKVHHEKSKELWKALSRAVEVGPEGNIRKKLSDWS
jgi:hypothetical protein